MEISSKNSYLILLPRLKEPDLDFQTSLVAIPEKGTMESTDSSLVIKKANSVTFMLTTATSFVNYNDISAEIRQPLAKKLWQESLEKTLIH